jgi:glycosyltransferase involved in cell wall biosynthesis
MRIWFVEIGEPLPIEANPRLYRYGQLTKRLAAFGHDVTWWTSSFSHTAKRNVVDGDRLVTVNGVHLRILYGKGYNKNISLQRVLHQSAFAKRYFREALRCKEPPDLIISPIPTLATAKRSIRLARLYKIPILLDIRDEWPDEFVDLCMKPLRPLVKFLLWPLFKDMTDICNHACGILAMSQKQLDYGLSFLKRARNANDTFFPLGYSDIDKPDRGLIDMAKKEWIAKGIRENAFVCCFFGTIGKYFNLTIPIKACKILSQEFDIQMVFCGNGSSLNYYSKLAGHEDHIFFPGWVNAPQIAALMELSNAGLAPYAAQTKMSLPNKPFEYFAGGLPVISSIQGELKEVIRQHQCGFTYEPDSLEEFICIVKTLQGDVTLRKTMGQRAQKLLQEQYSIEKIVLRLNDHLLSVVGQFKQNV